VDKAHTHVLVAVGTNCSVGAGWILRPTLVALLKELYGRGPMRTKSYWVTGLRRRAPERDVPRS
jgi:hypothetical protein